VSRIRKIQKLEAQGVPSKEAASQLKMHPFYVQKLYAQARNYSPVELDGVTVRLAELDHALKGGSRLANDLELERALVDVTQPAAA
jgi:DNA polymerase III delta subunit